MNLVHAETRTRLESKRQCGDKTTNPETRDRIVGGNVTEIR